MRTTPHQSEAIFPPSKLPSGFFSGMFKPLKKLVEGMQKAQGGSNPTEVNVKTTMKKEEEKSFHLL